MQIGHCTASNRLIRNTDLLSLFCKWYVFLFGKVEPSEIHSQALE
jgi:hypothetical protein